MGVNPYIQGTYDPTMEISHNFAKDAIEIRRKLPSTANNDINTLYGYGRTNPRAYQNAYKPPKAFPRSDKEMDEIMIRRVNARLRLKQEKHWRHLRIAGIALAAGWLFPVLCAVIARTWYAALAWIAS